MKQGDREEKKQQLRKCLEAQRDPSSAGGHANARSPGQSAAAPLAPCRGVCRGEWGERGPEGQPRPVRKDLRGHQVLRVTGLGTPSVPVLPPRGPVHPPDHSVSNPAPPPRACASGTGPST